VALIRILIDGLKAKRGFVGFLIAAALGALGVLGHAPFHIWPVIAVSLVGLVVMLDAAACRPNPLRSGFFVGWSWAFGYFLAGMFWVGNAFLVDAQKFAAIMPFAVTALPATLALFWGVGGLVYTKFWRADAGRLLVFALAFSVMEFGRGHLFTGLPWNLPSYIWTPGGSISQLGALIGPYGLTLATLFVLASPAIFLSSNDNRAQVGRKSISVAALLVSLAAIGYGTFRLQSAGPVDAMAGNGPLISAGQGGFTQKEVWDPANASRVTQAYLDLLEEPNAAKSDIVIWPEGAFPFLLAEQPEVLSEIDARLGTRTLVSGSIRRSSSPNGDAYWNSIFVFDRSLDGLTIRSTYDKFHLVPFGEYLPLRPLFKALGIASLVAYDGEMTPGPAPAIMAIKGAPNADPRVCYEIVFPNFNPRASGKAGWILNVSIDAWYGDLLGPDQHYAQARSRAIETGMPLVRAASGGWSAIVDRYGRVLSQHRFGAGYAMARLPLDARTTPYGRDGELIFALILAFLFVFVVFWRHKGVDFSNRLEDEDLTVQEKPNV
jgi:apolipoprotein N-acyltransferase